MYPVIPSWRGYDPFLVRNGVRYCCKLRWFTLYNRMQIILVIFHHWNSLLLSSLLHYHCSDSPTAMKEMRHAAILSIWRTMTGEAIWGAYWSHIDLFVTLKNDLPKDVCDKIKKLTVKMIFFFFKFIWNSKHLPYLTL